MLPVLENSKENPGTASSIFFKTDGHFPTQVEMKAAQTVTEYLQSTYDIKFPATDRIYNADTYRWEAHDLLGGFVRGLGKYYAGMDVFYTFTPTFETDVTYTMMPDGTAVRGDFAETLTNGYTDLGGHNLYWIMNYGHFTVPYYTYDNHLYPDGPR